TVTALPKDANMAELATLGLAADSSGLRPGVTALKEVTAEAGRAEKAVDSLAAKTETAGRRAANGNKQAASAAAQMAREIDRAAASMREYDRAARAADIAAYGAELDRLRAKYNPLFAASKRYEQELNELNRALK